MRPGSLQHLGSNLLAFIKAVLSSPDPFTPTTGNQTSSSPTEPLPRATGEGDGEACSGASPVACNASAQGSASAARNASKSVVAEEVEEEPELYVDILVSAQGIASAQGSVSTEEVEEEPELSVDILVSGGSLPRAGLCSFGVCPVLSCAIAEHCFGTPQRVSPVHLSIDHL